MNFFFDRFLCNYSRYKIEIVTFARRNYLEGLNRAEIVLRDLVLKALTGQINITSLRGVLAVGTSSQTT